jgi:hypothetical protein
MVGIVDAHQKLDRQSQAGAGSYLIFSQRTGDKARYEVDAKGTVRPMNKAEPQDT